MPLTIAVGNDAFANYLNVVALPMKERRIAFRELSNEQKASFVKVQFALQFIKQPDLTKEQADFLLEAISKTNADIYDTSDPVKVSLNEKIGQELEVKAMSIFEPKRAAGILAAFFANKEQDVALLQGYEDLLRFGVKQRKVLAKEMPMTERVNIWKTQLVYHLVTSSLNVKQKQFIVDIMPQIESILEASTNLSGESRTKYVDDLESRMFAVFSKPEAFAVFMSIGLQKQVNDDVGSTLQLLQWSCDCRWYCGQDNQSCRSTSCKVTTGCGPFDGWDCTSSCSVS